MPVVPGLLVALDADATPDLGEIGFPLMLKAAAGGGGRGMRQVDDAADLPRCHGRGRARGAGRLR